MQHDSKLEKRVRTMERHLEKNQEQT